MPDNAERVRVRVKLIYQAEYEMTLGSEGYGGATDVDACLAIDQKEWMEEDDQLFLQVTNARPVTFDVVSVTPLHNDGPKLLLPGECPHETTFLKNPPDGWACRDCGALTTY